MNSTSPNYYPEQHMTKFLSPLPSENNLRMTSMQIAELCGKEHPHVMRDIDTVLSQINHPEMDDLNLITSPAACA